MKTIDSVLLDHKAQPATTLCDLMLVGPLDDGTYRGFSSLNRDVVFTPSVSVGEITFYASTGVQMSAFQSSADLAVDNAEAQTLVPVAGYEARGFTQAQIDAGALDKVKFVVLRVNYTDLTAGRHEVIGGGTIGEQRIKSGGLTVLELRSLSQQAKQQFVEVDSLRCRAIFGSQPIGTGGGVVEERFPCGYDLTNEWVSGTITSVGDETDLEFTDSALSQAADYFAPGMIEILDGDNAGQMVEVDAFAAGGAISLKFPVVSPLVAGVAYRIRRHCTKKWTGHNSCETFWATDKPLHFRGEPHIPVGSAGMLNSPGAAIAAIGVSGTGEAASQDAPHVYVPGTDPEGDEPATPGTGGDMSITGALPNGYVGVPYDIDSTVDGLRVAGGIMSPMVFGSVAPGIIIGTSYGGRHFFGTPLTAGTYDVALTAKDTQETVEHAQSITILARPSYSVFDPRYRYINAVAIVNDATAPQTKARWFGTGGILTYQGADSGLLYAEVEITAIGGGGRIGIHAASLDNQNLTLTGTASVEVDEVGIYAIAFDCTTGSLWVSGADGTFTGDPAAGTGYDSTGLDASLSDDGMFRLGVHGSDGMEATVNCGNASWAYTLPTGFGGWAITAEEVGALWDTSTGDYCAIPNTYGDGLTCGMLTFSLPYEDWDGARATIGKSSGKWQFEVSTDRFENAIIVGLTQADFVLGANVAPGSDGSDDSVGLTIRSALTGTVETIVQTSFSGVHDSDSYTWSTAEQIYTFACDFDAGEVAIYRDGTLLHTVTSLPSGTWYPTAAFIPVRQISMVVEDLTHSQSGYSDWTVTP